MEKGENLTFTPAEEKKIEKTAEVVGVSAEQVQAILKQGLAEHEQSLSLTDKATKAITRLQERGKKELTGFDKVRTCSSCVRGMSRPIFLSAD